MRDGDDRRVCPPWREKSWTGGWETRFEVSTVNVETALRKWILVKGQVDAPKSETSWNGVNYMDATHYHFLAPQQ